MRNSARLFTTLLLCALPLQLQGQALFGIGSKLREAHDRLRAKEALGELETDAQGAQEYFALKRRIPGTKEVPVERYAVAAQEAERLPLRNTTHRMSFQKATFAGMSAASQASTGWETSSLVSGLDTWQPLGPYNVPGRSRALVFSPTNPNVMYTAGVAGGVWKSIDHGESWTPVGDAMSNIAVTSLAIDPTNSNIIYAGTGEGFGNFDAVRGLGVFKSTDGGANWVASTTYMAYVNDIVVSGQHIVFAASNDGVYRSTDGGASFLQIYSGRFTDLAMRNDSDVLFAAESEWFGSRVFRFLNASSVTPTSELVLPLGQTNYQWGRISLAIAPSNQNVVYALVASLESSREGSLEAVYRSNNGGATGSWNVTVDYGNAIKLNRLLLSNVLAANASQCGAGANFLYGQGWYDNVITVDPTNAERVWVGGTDLFRSDDGGRNWGIASFWWANDNDPSYVHADHHAIVFDPQYNGTTNRQIWVTNDGGVFRSNDALAGTSQTPCSPNVFGFQWQRKSAGLATTQFYGGAVFADGLSYFGGTQDNGTVRGSDTSGANAWAEILGGDGGKAAIDPTNPSIVYAAHPYLDIQRSTNGGTTWTPITRTLQDYGFFVTPFVLDATQPQRLWTGGIYVWRSDDRGTNWQRAGVITPGEGLLSAVAVSPVEPNNVVAGLSDGYLVSTGAGVTANANTQWTISKPRNGFISSIAFDPVDSRTAYVTYSSFNDFSTVAHIYKSTDLGATWLPLDGSGDFKIPDIPVNSLVVDPFIRTHLYIGTDIGVFVSLDGGLNWNRENTGFSNVVAESLVVSRNGSVANLFAFTHGRGVYRTTLRGLGIVVTPSVLDFGDFPVGQTSAPRTLTVSNPSSGTVTISDVRAPANFAVSANNCATLQPGESCTISVTMSPAVEGKLTGTVLISHDAATSPYPIEVRGRGVNSAFIVADKTSIDLGTTQAFSQGKLAEVTVQNIGNQPAYSITVDFPPMTMVSTSCPYAAPLNVGASCKVFVRLYSESSGGSVAQPLQIHSGSPSQTILVPLTGVVVPESFAIASVSPREIQMGSPAHDLVLSGTGFTAGMTILVNGVSRPFRFSSPTLVTLTLSASDFAKPGTLRIVGTNGLLTTRPAYVPVYIPYRLLNAFYDRYLRKFYGFINQPDNSKTFSRVDPETGVALSLQNYPHNPQPGSDDDLTGIASTADGRYLYFGVNGQSYRFDTRLGVTDRNFSLRRLIDGTPLCPVQFLPISGNNDAVVVNEKRCGISGAISLSVYVNGIVVGEHGIGPARQVHYGDGDEIYSFNGSVFNVYKATVNDGVTTVRSPVLDSFASGDDFDVHGHTLYRGNAVYDGITGNRIGALTRGALVFNVNDTVVNRTGTFVLRLGWGFETYDTATLDQVGRFTDDQSSTILQLGFFNSEHAVYFLKQTIAWYMMSLPGDDPTEGQSVPFINTISQPFTMQDSENVLLTVRGANFTTWSQVKWNGADRETEWVDDTTLKVFLPWTDFQAAGVNQITVANAQGQASAPVAFAVVAPLAAGQSALEVSNFGDGTGTVTSSVGSIDCGNTCLGILPANTTVTLTATPGLRSVLVGWGGECSGVADCTVTTSGIKSVTATFQATQHLLELEKKGSGRGTVSANAGNLDCGNTCSAYVDVAMTVTILAVPAPGSHFEGWSGACTGSGSCEVTMKNAQKVTATFRGADQLLLRSDLDGDGKADRTVWRPSSGMWFTIRSQDNSSTAQQWGAVIGGVQDIPVPGDYDGDGKADIAVWRPGDGFWYIRPSSAPGTITVQQWGAVIGGVQDVPVPSDYDGDGKTDIAVWRPGDGYWYIRPSSAPGTVIFQQWGAVLAGVQDVPVVGDYDGDGKADIAVWRPSSGVWFIRPSGTPGSSVAQQWGAVLGGVADRPVVADYDGDGKSDIAVWRPSSGTWFVRSSQNPGSVIFQQWGAVVGGVEDVPVPADYDGDGKADMAVWRPSSGTWFTLPSTTLASSTAVQWGTNGDIPTHRSSK